MWPLCCQILDKNVGRSNDDLRVQNVALYSETTEDQMIFFEKISLWWLKREFKIFLT